MSILNGHTQSREYAELIWGVDVAVMVVLITNAFNILMTIHHRVEPKLYVSLWYIIATVVLFPILYFIGNVMWNPPTGRDHWRQRHDHQLVLRPQRARPVVHDGPARGDLLHRPEGDRHAALQHVALAHRLLGHPVLLHRSRRAPPAVGAHSVLAQDDRGRRELRDGDPGARVHVQHPAHDAGELDARALERSRSSTRSLVGPPTSSCHSKAPTKRFAA